MNASGFRIEWVESVPSTSTSGIVDEEVMTMVESNQDEVDAEEYLVGEEIISSVDMNSIPNSLDQVAAENLIYMAQDGQVQAMGDLIEEQVQETDNANYNEVQYFECQVTEEVITDDWVQPQGEERVEIPVDQLCTTGDNQILTEIEVPLPTDQDQYTALRPYPCDFCSRRFRKKASLMNHMIAHQNDRPHICNLCGASYIRRSDLHNHFKVHAHVPADQSFEDIDESYLNAHLEPRTLNRGHEYYEEEVEEKDHDLTEKAAIKNRANRGGKRKTKIEECYLPDEKTIGETQLQEQVERYPVIDPRKPFVCQQCGISFAREKALLSHSRVHGGDSPYECTSCSEMFWDINLLHDHQRTHHFEASNSEYEPENEDDSESDNDSKYGDFYCNTCGMSFHRKDLLKRHLKTHVKKEMYEIESRHCCKICGETFQEALDLLAHAEVHARFQPFKCTLCGETFLEEATIKKHLTNVHSEEMNTNSCKLCGKQCRDGRSLMKHAWDHSVKKNHSCSICGKTFHNKARLKRHMVSHRNKSVRCDVCNEEFPDGRSLMNHRHSHNNTSGRQFPCNECGKTFGSRSSQQIHIRIHTGERPYGCRYCYKAFADGGTLRKHERIHTGEKPYACSVCPRAFNQRVVLREHIRSHHSAPDTKRGTALMPYYCTVCAEMFAQSTELVQHLIQHSDLNTAMQRQPVTGPRKYKRRRNLKPHELERLRTDKGQNSEAEYSDLDMGNVDDILELGKSKRSPLDLMGASSSYGSHSYSAQQSNRSRKYSAGSDKVASWQQKFMTSSNNDAYSEFNNLENDIKNIEPLVVNNTYNLTTATPAPATASTSKPKGSGKRRSGKQEAEKHSRPRMIHTQKTRVAVEDGKRKTRTMITRTEPTEIDEHDFQHFDRSRSERHRDSSISDYDMNPPLDTLRVRHTSQSEVKNEDIARSDLFDAQLLLEAASMRKELDKYNPDIVNDLEEILRSPIKQKASPSPQNSMIPCQPSFDPTSPDDHMDNATSGDDLRRSARIKRSAKNKKYLDFEITTKHPQRSTSSTSLASSKHRIANHEDNTDDIMSTELIIKQERIDVGGHSNEQQDKQDQQQQYYQCEMCFATFPDRAQLLVHVHIHI